MRRIVFAVAMVAAIALAYGLGRHYPDSKTSDRTGRHVLYYIDPMHPAYKSDKPGVAPDCGMALTPVYSDENGNAAATASTASLPAGAVSIDGATQRLLGIKLASVSRDGASHMVKVIGRVVPEDTRIYRINSGVDGFIRETFNDSVGVPVKKNQRLATYYAPDFITAASGFLAANERVPGSVSREGIRSLQNYSDRLLNLGMTETQIKQMAVNKQLPESVDVLSPADGFILARNITAGQHFEHDMEFYRIADLRQVWVVAEVFQQEAAYLHPGGSAEIVLKDEGRRLPARITDSLPQSEVGGGTVKLRLELDNPGFVLRPDMLVDVELPVHLRPAVTVPVDALVDSGARSRVYVESSKGVFEPRSVETGWRSADRVEILRGVKPGEQVVVAATFLVDSESRLRAPAPQPAAAETARPGKMSGMSSRAAAGKMVKDPSCGMPVDSSKAVASGNTLTYHGTTFYFCSKQCKETFQNDPANAAARRQGDDDD